MRLLLTIVLAATALAALAQEFTDADRFGKSCNEVLEMGHEEWVEWFTDGTRGTQSTAGMAMAERVYSECLRARTKTSVDGLSESEQSGFRALEKSMQSIAKECVRAGSALTGGGTMWIPVTDAAEVGVQDALWEILNPDLVTKKQSDQGAVWKEWKKAVKAIKANATDIDAMAGISGIDSKAALSSLDTVSKEFAEVVKSVATRPDKVKRRVFYQCRRIVEMVSLSG